MLSKLNKTKLKAFELTSFLFLVLGCFGYLLKHGAWVSGSVHRGAARSAQSPDDVHRLGRRGHCSLACQPVDAQEAVDVGEHAEEIRLIEELVHDVVEAAGVVQNVPEAVLQVL